MTDELATATNVAAHVGGSLGSGGLGAWLMHIFKAHSEKEEAAKRAERDQQIATSMALLIQKVDQIREDQKKHDGFGERLALVEREVAAAHKRLDLVQTARGKR